MMKLGFLGCGNMGGAIMRGLSKKTDVETGAFDVSEKALEKAKTLGAKAFSKAGELAAWADMLLLCVKPQQLDGLIRMIDGAQGGKPVISIVAGISTSELRLSFPQSRVLRVMPNTPAMVGKGMSALSLDTDFTEAEKAFADGVFASAGEVAWVQEKQMDAVTGVSGSGPAYVYLMIEAMTEAGVREGLPFDLAKRLAAQTVLGSAEMVLQNETHPAQLRAQVTSPAGTTAEALYILEKNGMKATVMEAVRACVQRSRELGKR